MARSYFSYSVVRSDPTNLTTGGDSILTTLKNVNWEVKKLDSSNNEVSTSIYTAITGNTTISGAAGVTDWNGLIEFWADAGQYVIKITDPSSRIANKNIYWDSVSGQSGGIPGSLITDETITSTQIKNSEVKTADIDSSAVTSAKIAAGTIAESNMADGTYVPVGAIMQFAGASAPTNWLLCDGSERQVSTYPALDAVLGTTYGARTNGSGGAGSSHFRLPDLRGRVVAGKDDMGGTPAGRLTATASGVTVLSAANTLGATGGSQVHTLSSSQIPAHSHPATSTPSGAHAHTVNSGTGKTGSVGDHAHTGMYGVAGTPAANGSFGGFGIYGPGGNIDNHTTGWQTGGAGAHDHSVTIDSGGSHSHTITVSNNTGGDGAHTNTQPTIVLNYIIRAV